ncbi:MAG: 5'/3'-nucleotidase SurE [Candidatus Krumholzibacteriota bacterium]|nr:5'/3'-nucleotidase SurE [Candidatus Krumholzibacteriota bacterium]
MRILLTNDDGIHAQGLQLLKEALAPLCELWVVAPSSQQSATSHSLTLGTILRRRKWEDRIFSVHGTPADSVLMGVNGLLKGREPDLVISGVNHGPNMGEDVHYSGTVAAAIEGAILGVPSVAISIASFRDQVFASAVRFMAETVRDHPERLTGPGTLLNINVPNLPWDQIQGVSVTRLGSRFYGDVIIKKQDPRGHEYFWIGGEEPTWAEGDDTDFHAVHTLHRISVTPLKLDFTDRDRIAAMAAWTCTFQPDEAGRRR